MFLGKLQHGTYDDLDQCEGLNEEEVNAFYGLEEDDESSDQSDEDDSDNDGNLELETDEEWIAFGDNVINLHFIK